MSANREIEFEYKMFGYSGVCHGVTVSKAIDNAKIRFLYQAYQLRLSDPTFWRRKAQLSGALITLRLTKFWSDRYVWLYKSFRDGDLLKSEIAELNQLTPIIRDPRLTR